jgi:ABC-2 type transport system ATP-binding protein/nitrous oxidase accessory protein
VISIQNLTKRFGRATAVDGVSLAVAPGESVALWGSNGAGKTTLIRCVLGLLPFQGAITVGGFDVRREGKRARRLIGYVPQELGFNDDLRVGESLCFFARLKGLERPAIDQVLERVGLCGQRRKRMSDLSGGMKQRLALAIALLGDPPALVLDEVTASLDACGREELVSLLSGLSRSGKSMLFASHRVEEVTTLASRVIMLEEGRAIGGAPAVTFVDRLGLGTVLHLHIKAPAREQAVSLLRTQGFDAKLNGVGLIVPVPTPQKAAPFRVLAEGRISVDDFDLLASNPHDHASTTQKEVAS